MAITAEEAQERELAAGHDRAKLAALEWAARAEAEYRQALRNEDYVTEHVGKPYLRDAVDRERQRAQRRSARAAEARQLAEMWARVAAVLVPAPEPLELITAEVATVDD